MGSVGVRGGLGYARVGAVILLSLALAHCGNSSKVDPKYGVSASRRVVEPGEPVPKGGGAYRVGKPYVVAGRTYVPEENHTYRAEGLASWYGDDFHGRLTANGEVFDMQSISAAHPTLPMPSYVRVTNLANRRSLVVRLNDRGPYHEGRVIDVSVRAAKLLGFHEAGTTRVRVEYVGRAALAGSDDAKLAATLRHGDRPGPAVPAVALAAAKPPYTDKPVHSEKPLHPEFFDPRPLTQRAPTVTPSAPKPGPAPVPTVAGDAPASFNARFAPAPGMVPAGRNEPVSAYGPGVPPRPEGVITGRGLY
jgi:rare lipoprotein A